MLELPQTGARQRVRAAPRPAIRVKAPSMASAVCLLGDLVTLGPIRIDEHEDGCDLVVPRADDDDRLRVLLEAVLGWLHTCDVPCVEVEANGRSFTVEA
jgi:hypothetical protein